MFFLSLLQWKSNVHAPYCHLWPTPLCSIFAHYLINGMIFEKKLLNTQMCVLIFSTIFSETFLIHRRIELDMIKNVLVVFAWRTHYSCPIFMKLEFSQQCFKNTQNIKFHENLSSGSWVVPCGQKDGWINIIKLIVAFRNFVNTPKNSPI